MRGEWNDLQAIFINDCPYAYYIQCLAYQLQFALIDAAREIYDIHTLFQNFIYFLLTLLVLIASVMMNYRLFKQLQLTI